MSQPVPRQPAPDLHVSLLDGSSFALSEQSPERFTLLVFYRGLHCPVCHTYLSELHDLLDKFAERGVEAVALSMDDKARAQQTKSDWDVGDLAIGYELSEEQARRWGLYLSESIADQEPDLFSEPGLFLVRPDGELYYAAINSMPFGRPKLGDLLDTLDFVEQHDYPARGEQPEVATAPSTA